MANEMITGIVLAAGRGKRMLNPLPKVLHPLNGDPMLFYPIRALKDFGAEDLRVVVGHGAHLVQPAITHFGVSIFEQKQQLGTANAVQAAQPETANGLVIILNGDQPLVTGQDLQTIKAEFDSLDLDVAVVSAELKNPGSLGRIVRENGQLHSIVEVRDAGAATLKINEVNSGLYLIKAEVLNELLPKISNHNQAQEFYLTDIIRLAREHKLKVSAIKSRGRVAFGVNSQTELAVAHKLIRKSKNQELMNQGVIMIDPSTTYVEATVTVGAGTVLHPGVHLEANTHIGPQNVIGPYAVLRSSTTKANVRIKAFSHIEGAQIDVDAEVGPYARIRPETQIGANARVGNFVELKKVELGAGAKANHLTYLGDAIIGAQTNIGCGTITCNYAVDRKKYVTKIGANAFVGSDVQFVAPVEVGDRAVIGSGSTITKNVPADALAVARSRQVVKEAYQVKTANTPDGNASLPNTQPVAPSRE